MKRYQSRETRFSNRVLLNYAAAQLPETLSVAAAAQDKPAEILLYDEIGFWGITAEDFALALAAAGDGELVVRINSPGGDVFDGMTIYNALKNRAAPVHVIVDGLAASAASFIAMAGTDLIMAEVSMLMIHNAWGIVIGDRNDMLETAGVMEKIDGQLAGIYATKCGKPVANIAQMMDDETWFTSNEAKDAGLCDVVAGDQQKARASLANRAAKRINASAKIGAHGGKIATALPAYDPDGDGDNDADEAMGYLMSAQSLIGNAMDALCGGDADGMPIVPGADASLQAAAVDPEWVSHPDETLPVDAKDEWDGPAAAERMLDAAGFNGNSPDPTKARRGFLVYDRANPSLKGSYKLPFADLVNGDLKAIKGGLDAAASRLPQTDAPDDIKTKARDVIDAYQKKLAGDDAEAMALAARQRRLRLAEAEAA